VFVIESERLADFNLGCGEAFLTSSVGLGCGWAGLTIFFIITYAYDLLSIQSSLGGEIVRFMVRIMSTHSEKWPAH